MGFYRHVFLLVLILKLATSTPVEGDSTQTPAQPDDRTPAPTSEASGSAPAVNDPSGKGDATTAPPGPGGENTGESKGGSTPAAQSGQGATPSEQGKQQDGDKNKTATQNGTAVAQQQPLSPDDFFQQFFGALHKGMQKHIEEMREEERKRREAEEKAEKEKEKGFLGFFRKHSKRGARFIVNMIRKFFRTMTKIPLIGRLVRRLGSGISRWYYDHAARKIGDKTEPTEAGGPFGPFGGPFGPHPGGAHPTIIIIRRHHPDGENPFGAPPGSPPMAQGPVVSGKLTVNQGGVIQPQEGPKVNTEAGKVEAEKGKA